MKVQPLSRRVRLTLNRDFHPQAIELLAGRPQSEVAESVPLLLALGAAFKQQIEPGTPLSFAGSAPPGGDGTPALTLPIRCQLKLIPWLHESVIAFLAARPRVEFAQSVALLLQYGALFKQLMERGESPLAVSASSQPTVASSTEPVSATGGPLLAEENPGDASLDHMENTSFSSLLGAMSFSTPINPS